MTMLNDFGKFSSPRLTVEECETVNVSQIIRSADIPIQIELNGQLVGITNTECNYGGARPWFICPGCSKRAGSLYRKPLSEAFLCRECQNLTYQLRKFHRSNLENFLKSLKTARD